MAVKGRGKHYQWDRMTRKHWYETAKANGLDNEIEAILSELVEGTEPVLNRIQAAIPIGFPASVAEPILMGLKKASRRLGQKV